jgi:thermostable 8-oxoguanine DNA glycosylase
MEDAWAVCADLFSAWSAKLQPCFEALDNELLFCLLGGFGISYEHNRSAAAVLNTLRPLVCTRSDEELRAVLVQQLERPQFEPRRKDGALRRYRFPARKAELIVAARRWFLERPDLADDLSSLATGFERRTIMCTCPGVGPKTASWLLRNLGLGDDLAIIDIHVLRALCSAGRIEKLTLPRDYALAEQAFLGWCRELGASPAAFDLFVWEWQRGDLKAA